MQIDLATSPDPPVKTRSKLRPSRNRLLAGAALLLLALIVFPPFINISRFRRTILRSVSDGLGRPVEASAVELVLFPRPGFVLHNLTVGEDPAYGAEPVMMAETVTAGLRASTLWHARVEIATLHFDAPSVNLVRNAEGQWNFESLLRSSRVLRGRGASGSSRRPLPFPYVEATDARINFKLGVEKLPFSLERADLAVWKESRHEWRLRIKARPLRTDLTMMDAGQIRGEGTLMTGGPLMNAPVRATLEWRRVQLGEIGRLFHKQDDGWRGTVDWTTQVQGTLADIALRSDIAVEEFRRAEFIPAKEMDLSAHCNARYARSDRRLNLLECNAPAGDGHLMLRSSGGLLPVADPSVSVQIALQRVPAGFFLDLLGHIHPGISGDVTVSGEVNGEADCDWRSIAATTACTGKIQSPEIRLHLPHIDRPLILSPFLLAASPEKNHPASEVVAQQGWNFSPLHVSLGGATPATITGTMNSVGSSLKINGAADLAEMARLAESLKIPVISGEVQSIHGVAQLALSLKSFWLPLPGANAPVGLQPIESASAKPVQVAEFAPSRWTGSVQVQNATLKLAMLPVALQLTSARVDITPTGVEWNALEGAFAHIPFDGRIQWQTPCPTSSSPCARSFALHTPNLNAEHLQAVLSPPGGESNLLDLINPWAGSAPQLPEISGTFNADVLSAGRVSMKDAVLRLRMDGQSAELTAISGKLFGGTISGAEIKPAASGELVPGATGSMRWGNGAPVYALRAMLQNVQPDRVGAIWHEKWGPGVANLQIDLKTQGRSAAELAQNASGQFNLEWLNGSLGDATATSPQPAIEQFQRWSAKGRIRDQALVFDSSKIIFQHGHLRKQNSLSPTQSVTGSVSFTRMLDLQLEPSRTSITGPLSMPVVKTPDDRTTNPAGTDDGLNVQSQ